VHGGELGFWWPWGRTQSKLIGREGGRGSVCSSGTGLQEGKEKGIGERTATAAPKMAGGEVAAGMHPRAPWRPQEGTPGRGYDGGQR
jgi:hypothetical protein